MKIVFLDRDGTLIQDPVDERVNSVEEIELFPDTIEALKLLADNGFSAIIITNQAGIAEGLITEAEFWNIHNEVLRQLESSGITILKTYMNAEQIGSHVSNMRKPGPGMLLQAGVDFHLDLSKIYMVGDRQSDVDAGLQAGCKGSILVETARNIKVISENATFTAPTLLDAVTYVVQIG